MIIKALRNFFQNGHLYETGNQYHVTDLRVHPAYYEVISNDPEPTPPPRQRKRQVDTGMKPKQVRKTVMRRAK